MAILALLVVATKVLNFCKRLEEMTLPQLQTISHGCVYELLFLNSSHCIVVAVCDDFMCALSRYSNTLTSLDGLEFYNKHNCFVSHLASSNLFASSLQRYCGSRTCPINLRNLAMKEVAGEPAIVTDRPMHNLSLSINGIVLVMQSYELLFRG